MRVAAILGPRARRGDLRPFEAAGVEIAAVTDLAADAAFDAALILGGDGSIHRQLRAAVESRTPVLCVPAGSGNDFARALGIRTRSTALEAWRRFCGGGANVREVDVAEIALVQEGAAAAADLVVKTPSGGPGEARGRTTSGKIALKPRTDDDTTQKVLYCCVAGAGLDSEVNRRANLLPWWLRGHGGYVLSVPGAVLAFDPPEVTIQLMDSDGVSCLCEPAMMVAFANAPCYGHGMRIAPRASLDDGKLDVCFVRRTSKLRLLRLFPSVFFGAHLSFPEIEYAQCSGLKIASGAPLDIFGDGEFIGRTPAEVRVRPRALRVIAP